MPINVDDNHNLLETYEKHILSRTNCYIMDFLGLDIMKRQMKEELMLMIYKQQFFCFRLLLSIYKKNCYGIKRGRHKHGFCADLCNIYINKHAVFFPMIPFLVGSSWLLLYDFISVLYNLIINTWNSFVDMTLIVWLFPCLSFCLFFFFSVSNLKKE